MPGRCAVDGENGHIRLRLGADPNVVMDLCYECFVRRTVMTATDSVSVSHLERAAGTIDGVVWRRGKEHLLLRRQANPSPVAWVPETWSQPEAYSLAMGTPLPGVGPAHHELPRPPSPEPPFMQGRPSRTFMDWVWAPFRFAERHFWPMMAAASVLFAVSAGVMVFVSEDVEAQRFAVLYMTDLPGGLERLEVTIAGCSVGAANHTLRMELPVVELSTLQGPEAAVRVCSGWVPAAADPSVSVHFGAARGFKDGTWVDVQLPHPRLTLPEGLPSAELGESSAVLDIGLDTSIVERDGDIVFEPFVQSVYHRDAGESEGEPKRFKRIDAPEQFLEDLPERRPGPPCTPLPTCLDRSSEIPSGPATAPACPAASEHAACPSRDEAPRPTEVPSPSPIPVPSRAPAGGGPPHVPSNPTPGVGATVTTSHLLLTWEDGDLPTALDYTVVVDGATMCVTTEMSCELDALGPGANHVWHVTSTAPDGKARRGPAWTFHSARPPDPAQLASPSNGSRDLDPGRIELAWTGSDPDGDQGLRYHVLGGVAGLTESSLCTWQAARSCEVGLLEFRTYGWRVVTRDATGAETSSPVWTFTTKVPGAEVACRPPLCLP